LGFALTIYDLALFEELNAEYESRPIVDREKLNLRRKLLAPTEENLNEISQEERIQAAVKRQIIPVTKDVEIAGRHVLELGCGSGYASRAMLEHGGAAKVTGIDISRNVTWEETPDPRLTFIEGDLSAKPLVEPESVDLVVSHVVFEHVTRPLQMLSAIRDVLRNGGSAWLRMNIYTACNASHRYAEISFPWPHLLFEDEVVRQFYELHHNCPNLTTAWVNRMTVAHYLMVCQNLGFEIAKVRRRVAPIDIPFYLRFHDKLSRYAALDLETNFLNIVLHKRPQTELTDISVASIDYLARERSLEERIRRHKRSLRRQKHAATLESVPSLSSR
jgi:SAM-dependent methyltransferase